MRNGFWWAAVAAAVAVGFATVVGAGWIRSAADFTANGWMSHTRDLLVEHPLAQSLRSVFQQLHDTDRTPCETLARRTESEPNELPEEIESTDLPVIDCVADTAEPPLAGGLQPVDYRGSPCEEPQQECCEDFDECELSHMMEHLVMFWMGVYRQTIEAASTMTAEELSADDIESTPCKDPTPMPKCEESAEPCEHDRYCPYTGGCPARSVGPEPAVEEESTNDNADDCEASPASATDDAAARMNRLLQIHPELLKLRQWYQSQQPAAATARERIIETRSLKPEFPSDALDTMEFRPSDKTLPELEPGQPS